MDPPNRKRYHYENLHLQLEANGEVNGINHVPNAEGNNHHNNHHNNNNNNIEELGWKMAALEARNRMLEVTLENHGLRAENISLQGENKSLKFKEAEQAVQIGNIEKLGEFLQNLTALQEQNRMEIAVLKEQNCAIWEKLKEVEEKEEQQRKEIAEQKILNQTGTKALWRQLKEVEQKLKTNMKSKLKKFAKKMEQKHEKEIADLKVENLQLSENIQMDQKMREFGKKLALLEEQKKDTIQWDQIKSTILWPFLVKDRRLLNPKENAWNSSKTKAIICPDGLGVLSINTGNDNHGWHNVFASEAFAISAEQCRKDFYPGTILRYFEVTRMTSSDWAFCIGLSNGYMPDSLLARTARNCYCFPTRGDNCYLSGIEHYFIWPKDAIKPEWNGIGDTLGCGILLNPKNELAIFFTANGILMGKQIQLALKHPCDFLIPTVSMKDVSLEANFGHDLVTKPFKYDTEKWPGLTFHQ